MSRRSGGGGIRRVTILERFTYSKSSPRPGWTAVPDPTKVRTVSSQEMQNMNQASRLRLPDPQGTTSDMLYLGPTVIHRPAKVWKSRGQELAAKIESSAPSNRSALTNNPGAYFVGLQPSVLTPRGLPTFNLTEKISTPHASSPRSQAKVKQPPVKANIAAEEECLIASVNHEVERSEKIVKRSDVLLAELGK